MDLTGIASRAFRKVFSKKLKKGDLDPELYKETYLELMRAVKQGLGYDTGVSIGYRDNRFQVANKMRSNIFTFTAFKNHSNIVDMVNALTDDKGKLRSWSKFKQEAQRISHNYNKNWLQAEWQTAKGASESALKWEQMFDNKDVLPYLQYKTQNDSRVRQSHMQLHNITRAIDDPFWDEFFPPNGWRCRCYTLQQGEPGDKVEPEGPLKHTDFPPAFRNNPGKTSKIYSDDHPFLDMVDDPAERTAVRNAYQDILGESDLYDVTAVDEMDIQFHVTHPVDQLAKNLGIAHWLRKRFQVSTKLAPVKRNQKNPDALTVENSTPVAFKQTSSVTGIRSRLKNAAQKADIVAIEITEVAPTAMKKAIGEFFRTNERIREIYVSFREESYLIRRESYLEDLKAIN